MYSTAGKETNGSLAKGLCYPSNIFKHGIAVEALTNAMKACQSPVMKEIKGPDENGNVNLNQPHSSRTNLATDPERCGSGNKEEDAYCCGEGAEVFDKDSCSSNHSGKRSEEGCNLAQMRAAARRGEDDIGGRRRLERKRSGTCIAMKTAFSVLYGADEFWRERIAAGFFSVVYKVTHRSTGEVMVMKMSQQTNTRANNLHEIELLNQLHHPNILRFKGVCIEEGHLHALTEYVNGGSLQDLLCDDREYLSWTVRLKLCNDIAKGMKYLHAKGFMHRDLSSQNILVRRKNLDLECVIADLGLATRIPRFETEVLPIVGTPFWISPECLHGMFYNEKSDVFSFGIVTCEIIARVSADPEELPRTIDFGVNEAAFRLLARNCPPDILDLALQCCKLSPKERPSFYKIVHILSEMRHPYVTNVSKSLSSTEMGSGTASPRHFRSRTSVGKLSQLTKKKRKQVVRSNSDSGSRVLNIKKVSEKLNPFYESHSQEKRLDITKEADEVPKALMSPTFKLCNDLSSVWPERMPLLRQNLNESLEMRRSSSLPSISPTPYTYFVKHSDFPSDDDIRLNFGFDMRENFVRDFHLSAMERLSLQETV
ncbi:Dual specificity testis-specific protein kinase 2 [Holothuria leucospilota]|uniref:dual-specificity kinase n=1 Tax=Holothuria leucospilota TaxID=206669 RepID=A0A9Q1C7V7_HOLLE|nr:Dual specificity testis-specific protein kinase 2 [Holothuria leucospilota]